MNRLIEKLATAEALDDVLKDFLEKHKEEIKKLVQREVSKTIKKLADDYMGALTLEDFKRYLNKKVEEQENKL